MSRVAGTESFVFSAWNPRLTSSLDENSRSSSISLADHTMLRIKDPKASLKFYTEILGMELIRKSDGGDFVSIRSSPTVVVLLYTYYSS
jgi:hypothetical protein